MVLIAGWIDLGDAKAQSQACSGRGQVSCFWKRGHAWWRALPSRRAALRRRYQPGSQAARLAQQGTFSSHRARDALLAADTWAARCVPSVGRSRGGLPRHAPSRSDHEAPLAAHTFAAQCRPSVSHRQRGQTRRAIGTERACLAVIATHPWRHTRRPSGADPLLAAAGEGSRDPRAAQSVLVSQRPRRTASGARVRNKHIDEGQEPLGVCKTRPNFRYFGV